MWKILLAAALLILSAIAAQSEENSTEIHSPETIISQSSTTAKPTTTISIIPESSEHPAPEEPAIEEEPTTTPRRAQITYDQRQDGQYNIRADLENFMIVVIPPNPVAGVNLLDLLTRSSTKRANLKKINKKHQLSGKHNNGRPDEFRMNFFNHIQQQQQPEFIEGRTPYRVDISSNAETNYGRLHPDPQVDVLPPPYPVHLHLMRPYHLEAEPSVVQSAPQGKLFELFNRLSLGEGRLGKAIRDHSFDNNELHTNRIVVKGDGRSLIARQNAERGGHGDNRSYVQLTDTDDDYSFSDSVTLGDDNSFTIRSLDSGDIDGGELKLIGATEQCGPGRRRNSYGICQHVPDLDY